MWIFAGTWKSKKPEDLACVRSLTDYVIALGGSPLTWTSQLILDICLSAMMVKNIALLMCLRKGFKGLDRRFCLSYTYL